MLTLDAQLDVRRYLKDNIMIWNERQEPRIVQPDDAREEADVDYARVVHSGSFRRLQGKTQTLNLGDGDFYRTRLTHSLEVAQIASGIELHFRKNLQNDSAIAYLPNTRMIQAIALTHDLGHPPFGHGGEIALNYCMREHGGFEGNGQTLRILSKLEKFSNKNGANLTRRTLLGVMKYPISYSVALNSAKLPMLHQDTTSISIINRDKSKPPKCYMDSEQDVVDWVLSPLQQDDRDRFCSFEKIGNEHSKARHKSFDCSIMDLADDIAFGVHDLEDGLALQLIIPDDFRDLVPLETCEDFLRKFQETDPIESNNMNYDDLVRALFGEGRIRKRFISQMVHYLVTHCRIKVIDEFNEPLIRYRATMEVEPAKFLEALKKLVRTTIIFSPNVQHLEFKGQKMVVSVFEALNSEPKKFLPRDTLREYIEKGDSKRVICDHIAGMTDNFLLKTYDRLFSPRMGSVFDRL